MHRERRLPLQIQRYRHIWGNSGKTDDEVRTGIRLVAGYRALKHRSRRAVTTRARLLRQFARERVSGKRNIEANGFVESGRAVAHDARAHAAKVGLDVRPAIRPLGRLEWDVAVRSLATPRTIEIGELRLRGGARGERPNRQRENGRWDAIEKLHGEQFPQRKLSTKPPLLQRNRAMPPLIGSAAP